MGYDQVMENRINQLISRWKNKETRKMFGGVCHLLKGTMFCGVYKDFLILRLGEKGSEEALSSPFTRPFDITGKPMKGWVMVQKQGIEKDEDLEAWLKKARDFVNTLPVKKTRAG
jgi:TfoX/Sxy family transcriptional regulator of competence genes